MKRYLIYILTIIGFLCCNLKAQEVIELPPLFEYPVPPEELESLDERCDYIVKHFWDNFDFKKKDAVDQYALNSAFGVFTTSLQYASKKEADKAIDNLLSKISNNPTQLLQFTKAAEENLYGPRAEVWIDEIYLKFADAIAKNKKVSDSRKSKYILQEKALTGSKPGQSAPTFTFTDIYGQQKNYYPMSTPTILIFGNPDDTDWMMARLKMESNFTFRDALDKGKINVLYILPNKTEGWKEKIANYNLRWSLGASPSVSEIYDTRLPVSIFLVDSSGKIVDKFLPVEAAVGRALELIN